MSTLRVLIHMARADFLERTRTSAFLFTLAAAIYAAHAFLPPAVAPYATLQIGGWRGAYGSAWVGVVVALLAGVFLSLVGFYLVKNAVDRDRTTRVGEILAATRLSKSAYTLGKTLSNFLVLAAMTAVMAAAAGAVQVLRGEDPRIDLVALAMPFVVLTLPAMLLTAALAVLFETLPGLRGGGGNVAYFFVWTALLSSSSIGGSFHHPTRDWTGRGTVLPGMVAAAREASPGFDPDSVSLSMGLTFRDGGWRLHTFPWSGPRWTAGDLAGRAAWVLLAIGIALAAAIPFDRFDPARAASPSRAPPRRAPWRPWGRGAAPLPAARPAASHAHVAALPPAVRAAGGPLRAFAPLLIAELRLAWRGRGRFWFVVVLGLSIAAALTPIDIARGRLLPLLWVWPILAWSPLGTRERRHGTEPVLFSAPHPVAAQVLAAWAAGALLALATGAVVEARLAFAGDGAGMAALLAGAAFVPALALALGTLTGTSRAFEAIYVAWWYVGPLQPVPALDFMGASRAAVERGMPLVYAGAALALLAAAMAARAARLGR